MIGSQDGVDQLVEVIDYIVHGLGKKNVRCVIVGEGVALEALRQMASDRNLNANIDFVGWVDYNQVPAYLSMFDVCAAPEPPNPYNNNCTMIKIMEYMAFGKPIVAFDLLEHRRSAGGAALYVASREDFAEAIIRLMDDAGMRRSMGQEGRNRIEGELAWEHQAEKLLSVYDRILPGRLES
jgi:glycosyltransferase involved in cell wall biosynthesis